ncbi:arsenosugar biosynthesis radical SAM protein ArsS [Thermoleptolyngbya sichuanensis XZ-Cy5]|uniref:arsenosugar biosynthesis radical SAM (seleno)protein ArsS n=1 Tax=Thermoleptolyngbya sichuanensis TaxID=2885951 RepID=UPI00240D7F9D|nr:arsenosugar biosynthesis radical SAM (seleno)protein ArsS [Thermoleptolyngbya sichuanensis]MDG2615480.1 arsenosugar biosynthesis radical SAM protein ArsS [Thermoleptolyngbya sichuanensis XZ-Cy5]
MFDDAELTPAGASGAIAARISQALDLENKSAGPKPTTSLLRRRSPLANPQQQLQTLESVPLEGDSRRNRFANRADFAARLQQHGWPSLRPATLEIFQINVGKLCNMTCRHCHVDAGPDRHEVMSRDTIEACLRALDQTTAHTVDITGGAPELNPHFRYLVEECVQRGKHVIDRCNLTVLLIPSLQDLPEWLAERGVEVVCSLPHYRQFNTDSQRGDGTFEKSIEALRRLNAAGYGQGDAKRRLTLMSNPVGAFLAGSQVKMEQEWKAGLLKNHGVTFDRLIALNNMPISRYLEWLEQSGNLERYLEVLVNAFNPATISGLMCRNTLSISWDGRLFDCDFNQMLELPVQLAGDRPATVHDFHPDLLAQREIVTARHCFGCTAGAGSSCGGAIE